MVSNGRTAGFSPSALSPSKKAVQLLTILSGHWCAWNLSNVSACAAILALDNVPHWSHPDDIALIRATLRVNQDWDDVSGTELPHLRQHQS